MVELSIAEGKLMLCVIRADKLWALKSSLEIPLVHIAGVRADAEGRARLVARNQAARNQCARGDHGGNFLSGRQASFLGCSSSRKNHRH